MLWLRKKGFRINLRHLAGGHLVQLASAAALSAKLSNSSASAVMLICYGCYASEEAVPFTCQHLLRSICHTEGQGCCTARHCSSILAP